MAWALLACPEAPRDFRAGLLRIAMDEVRHMQLYTEVLERHRYRGVSLLGIGLHVAQHSLGTRLSGSWFGLRSSVLEGASESAENGGVKLGGLCRELVGAADVGLPPAMLMVDATQGAGVVALHGESGARPRDVGVDPLPSFGEASDARKAGRGAGGAKIVVKLP
jgi:hypothetical protein